MTIYLSHSTNYDYTAELYQPLKDAGLSDAVILPHDVSAEQYPTKKLFMSRQCDLVIAEVSYPSTGQGIELGWANLLEIPVVCLYKKGALYSGAVNVITDQMLEYYNSADLIEKIKNVISVRS